MLIKKIFLIFIFSTYLLLPVFATPPKPPAPPKPEDGYICKKTDGTFQVYKAREYEHVTDKQGCRKQKVWKMDESWLCSNSHFALVSGTPLDSIEKEFFSSRELTCKEIETSCGGGGAVFFDRKFCAEDNDISTLRSYNNTERHSSLSTPCRLAHELYPYLGFEFDCKGEACVLGSKKDLFDLLRKKSFSKDDIRKIGHYVRYVRVVHGKNLSNGVRQNGVYCMGAINAENSLGHIQLGYQKQSIFTQNLKRALAYTNKNSFQQLFYDQIYTHIEKQQEALKLKRINKRDELADMFSCQKDADCVAIAGPKCGLRSIFAAKSKLVDTHRCECRRSLIGTACAIAK